MLAGYPRSHLEAVSDFLSGQFQQDAVGPLLGSTDGSSDTGSTGGGAAAAAGSGSSSGSMLDVVMEVLGRQALVQGADSTAASPTGGSAAAAGLLDGSSGSATSLAQLLAGLDAACSAAFDRTSAVISPTLRVTGSSNLGPSPSSLALGYISTDGEAADASLVAAAAWEGQQHVLLVRGAGGGSSREQEGSEAAVLLLPGGDSTTDLALYKEGRLAVLLAGTSCRLALLPPDALQWVRLPPDLLAEADALQLAQMLLESTGSGSGTAWPGEAVRQRVVPYPRAQAPLAVSASRGVGCVLAGTQASLGRGGAGETRARAWMSAWLQVRDCWVCPLACVAPLLKVCCEPMLNPAACPCPHCSCSSGWCCTIWRRTKQRKKRRRRRRAAQLLGRMACRAIMRRRRAACDADATAHLTLTSERCLLDKHGKLLQCSCPTGFIAPDEWLHLHKCTCKCSCTAAGQSCLHGHCALYSSQASSWWAKRVVGKQSD